MQKTKTGAIIYPIKPIIDNDKWKEIKQDLYNTFIVTKKFTYFNPVYGDNLESFILENAYMDIEIKQCLTIIILRKTRFIELEKYKPLFLKITRIIENYYPDNYKGKI